MFRSRFLAFVVFVSMVTALVPLSQRAAAVSTSIVISEFRVRGPNGGNDEFIELYNPTALPIDLSFHRLQYKSVAGAAYLTADLFAFPMDTFIAPRE